MVTLTMSTYQIHTDTEWRFFKVVGRVLAAILTLTACYIHALTIKHAVTPKFCTASTRSRPSRRAVDTSPSSHRTYRLTTPYRHYYRSRQDRTCS